MRPPKLGAEKTKQGTKNNDPIFLPYQDSHLKPLSDSQSKSDY